MTSVQCLASYPPKLLPMFQEYQLHEEFQRLIFLPWAIPSQRLSSCLSTCQIRIHPLVHNIAQKDHSQRIVSD